MKSVYREKLFYGIQHLENFLLIFFLGTRLAPPAPAVGRLRNPETTNLAQRTQSFAAQSAPLAMTD
jgi:hypothetical protein